MKSSIKILVIMCSFPFFISCGSDTSTTPDEQSLIVTFEDSLSYSMGINMAQNLPETQLNHDLVKEGMDDYWQKKQPRLNNADRQTVLREFNIKNSQIERDAMQVAGEDAKELSRENKILGQEFLEDNKVKEGVRVRQRSGLQYKILKEGSGQVPDYDDVVTVHYTGSLLDGHKFDSSYDRGKPAEFGVNGVIKGWTEILQIMPVGSKWEVYIPHNLAYGETGIRGSKLGEYVIPPSSVLIFQIELLGIAE
ncbi:MAG: FKBP-type peptidyl-prolyl cis-trans isomerase [Candidatus Marinimicrobia bacterium]|jgi:FKBP-type peptidyl-prolyl cis-trans isomerase|nr:FKBP-type peptidyl-prolyl cis-trans isomerase [Candidatus Neomarinimicrobiota bacterium]|tara:strand:+ start:153 stop:905 length:753 start_codon:yes stop_codon:yes gene_type:complete